VQSQLLADGGERILSSADTAEAGRPTFDLGTASREFIEANPEFLTQWAKAQDYAVKLIQDDPEKAAESVGAVLGIDPADAQKQFAGLTYLTAADQAGPDYLGGKLGTDLFATAEFNKKLGQIPEVQPEDTYTKAVVPTFAESVGK